MQGEEKEKTFGLMTDDEREEQWKYWTGRGLGGVKPSLPDDDGLGPFRGVRNLVLFVLSLFGVWKIIELIF